MCKLYYIGAKSHLIRIRMRNIIYHIDLQILPNGMICLHNQKTNGPVNAHLRSGYATPVDLAIK